MSQNINHLPYFKIKPDLNEKIRADFLLRKFRSRIKENFPQHYLVQPVPHKTLKFISESSRKYPYFLRFDVRLYYPSVDHQILLKKLPEIYQKISGQPPSRRFNQYFNKELPGFLRQSAYQKGLPIGSRLASVLAGLFLLDLDLEIKQPFLRQADDYLIFCRDKKEPEILLKNVIVPKLKELELEINEKKLQSGKFHQDKVNFIGFDFYAGYFTVSPKKIDLFKKKINQLTYLTKKKSKETIIKSLNNQILGFGHYYKFASGKRDFADLDAFIRMRLRRKLLNQKGLLPKEGNLVLTNQVLTEMGLKSLAEIKEKFDSSSASNKLTTIQPKQLKTRKVGKNNKQTGQINKSPVWAQYDEIRLKYQQKLILDQLRELTSLTNKLNKRMIGLEKKLRSTEN